MSLTKTLVVLVVLMVCGSTAFAGGYQINEHGARAMGMGGAFVVQASMAQRSTSIPQAWLSKTASRYF